MISPDRHSDERPDLCHGRPSQAMAALMLEISPSLDARSPAALPRDEEEKPWAPGETPKKSLVNGW